MAAMNTAIRLVPLALLLAGGASFAQAPDLFAAKPYAWKAAEKDARLPRTKLYKALSEPPRNPACAKVAATLLMAFAESAPYFHEKDDAFVMFQSLVAPITTPAFPANEFLLHMLRRAMIDQKAPEAWLAAGRQLKARLQAPIDLERLAYAVDGPQPIDSVYFGLNAFLERHQTEVLLAPSLAQDTARGDFEDRYLGRDVAWGGLLLVDVHKEESVRPKGKKGQAAVVAEPPAYVATLVVPQALPPPDPLFPRPRPEPIRLRATLLPEQYLDVKTAVRSGNYLVHGRLWNFKTGTGVEGSPPFEFEIRDALLFKDRDWTGFAGFADARDVAACELCVNDLSPYGLRQHQGVGVSDGFGH